MEQGYYDDDYVKIDGKWYIETLRFKDNLVADAWENSVVRRALILTLIVLAISLIFTGGYNLGKIVGAETQTEEYLDGRLEQ